MKKEMTELTVYWTEQLDSPLGDKPENKTEVVLRSDAQEELREKVELAFRMGWNIGARNGGEDTNDYWLNRLKKGTLEIPKEIQKAIDNG